jgi:uncharacterized metal-binding protein YceD (DUF177 family)
LTNSRACDDQPQNELSRVIAVDEFGEAGINIEIEASADERAALARRFGLIAIDDVSSRMRVRRLENGGVGVRGRFSASLVQHCVVTLEPVAARVEDVIEVLYSPFDGGEGRDVSVVAFGDDAPEPLRGDVIDVGEVVAESLGLAIDSYPRRPGATFASIRQAAKMGEDPPPESPFAALRNLKPGP